jgi:hypothetical protein
MSPDVVTLFFYGVTTAAEALIPAGNKMLRSRSETNPGEASVTISSSPQ